MRTLREGGGNWNARIIIANPAFKWPRFHQSVDWQTPPEIVRALGKFDLDPCAAPRQFYRTARVMWKKGNDGLHKEWFGRVWLNPPYDRFVLPLVIKKMAGHANGIALVPVKFTSEWFKQNVIGKATAMLFLETKIPFYRGRKQVVRGKAGASGDNQSEVLVAYGRSNAAALRRAGIPGLFVVPNR